jgi:hypothetical protein
MKLISPIGRWLGIPVLIICGIQLARGCECPDTSAPPACARFWRSNIVFTAVVSDISEPPAKSGSYPEGTVVSLSVQKSFKGIVGPVVRDLQGHEIDCKRVYELGKEYLIYADTYDVETKIITTVPCFGRIEASHARDDLKYVSQLAEHKAQSAIAGKVLNSRREQLKSVKVLIEGPEKTFESQTDEDGGYNIVVAKPGAYLVKIEGRFAAFRLSFGAAEDSFLTPTAVQYKLTLVQGQCDYREVILYQYE